MHNLAAVLPSIDIMTHPLGLHLSAAKVGASARGGEERGGVGRLLPGVRAATAAPLVLAALAFLHPPITHGCVPAPGAARQPARPCLPAFVCESRSRCPLWA